MDVECTFTEQIHTFLGMSSSRPFFFNYRTSFHRCTHFVLSLVRILLYLVSIKVKKIHPKNKNFSSYRNIFSDFLSYGNYFFLLFILWQLFFQIFLSYSNYFFTFHPMADIFSFLWRNSKHRQYEMGKPTKTCPYVKNNIHGRMRVNNTCDLR